MQAKSHKDLIVWQRAMSLVKAVYMLTEKFPSREIYGLASQMRRAAVSIPSNISEGRNRGTAKDFAHFLRMAYGSSAELETQIEISNQLGFVDGSQIHEANTLLVEVSKMLRAMISKLG
ncbi:four helix bundle protein [Candidatus Kaiserbacteria bacterium]|nr:four helix bundle protein [Candidatus Kaiserbacteria bacterium]